MKLDLDSRAPGYLIRAYERGRITVNEEVLTRSFVLTPERLLRDWPPQSAAELAAEHFELVAALEPEVVLLGSGARLRWPAAAVIAPLTRRSIAVEVMDTGAACRSYSILQSEQRRVAAALLMIEA